MIIEEFIEIMCDGYVDLDLMAKGHPFTKEEILEQMDMVTTDSAQMVVLKVLYKHASQ